MRRTREEDESVDAVRRRLLRTSAVFGGVFALGQIPYSKPAIKSFLGVRSAWAQPTGPSFTIECFAEASRGNGPGTACQNAIIQNVSAQVAPAPPAGTLLRCTPTTDDPTNATLPNFSSATVPTDGAGLATFAVMNLTGNVPSPPLAIGSVLTMTVTFDDQGMFGSATCVNQFTIVSCP